MTLLLVVSLLAPSGGGIAQVSTKIASITPSETEANIPVAITANLIEGETVERVYLVYRPFGEGQFTRMEMDIIGNVASATLPPKDIQPPGLEYYVVLVTRTGALETYPLSETADPFTNPPQRTLRLAVRAVDKTNPDVVFLSPEPNGTVPAGEVVISFSLLRADSTVVRRATQVVLDGVDISSDVVFSGDMGVYVPENVGRDIAPGTHKVSVRLYNRDGHLHQVANLTFHVPGMGVMARAEAPRSEFTYNANVHFESRHEQVNTRGTWYNRGGYRFSGRTGFWRFTSNAFVTSDELSSKQPQNRFFVGAESPWLRMGYGDSYPSFPDLILSGKRVRGLHSALRLGVFNVDMTLGKTIRGIEGTLLSTVADSLLAQEQMRDPGAAYGPVSPGLWGKFRHGTYARDLFAIRPSFGSGETWQLGFTWMKSKDDVGSIAYGSRPQENLVFGADFVSRFDANRIELSGQAAFSAYNSDISAGNITDAQIAKLFPKDSSTIKEVRDLLSQLITVNENLRPLSVERFPTIAYDGTLRLSYFDNVFKFTYLFRGKDYTSFGQSFLRKDIQGFNVQDRVRLFKNQVFATVGYERLRDNTDSTKVATTTYSNYNLAVSYMPGPSLPGVTVGFSRFVNNNGLPVSGPDSMRIVSAINDVTNRIFVQSTYDFMLGALHTATMSLSSSQRDDATPRQLDVNNFAFSLGLSSRFGIPLQTGIDFTANFNKLPLGAFRGTFRRLDYSSVALQTRYELVEGVFSLLGAFTPTFGDFTRNVGTLEADWRIVRAMNVILEFSYFGNQDLPNDSFLSFRYRYDL